jgi:PAS domain S-box-containing protein
MSGLSAAESLGHGWKKVLHPDDRQTVFEGRKTTLQGGASWEYRLLTPQGEIRWIRALGGPIYSERGALTGYVGTLEDVTERKRAAERFRMVFEAAPSGMVIMDRDGKIVLVNSRAEELFGYGREELLGNSIKVLVPEASREAHVGLRRQYFARLLARPMGLGKDLYARRKAGALFAVEIGLNPIETKEGACVLSSIVDISDRRHAEEERQKFVSLADRSMEFIGMCDLDFRPFSVNSAGMRLVGLDNLEAACRVKVQDYFFQRPAFVTNEFFQRVQRDGHGEVEIRFRHFKTGAAIWMLYYVFNIFDSRGALVLGHCQHQCYRSQAGGGCSPRGSAATATRHR